LCRPGLLQSGSYGAGARRRRMAARRGLLPSFG
jgi:hypothetical protein